MDADPSLYSESVPNSQECSSITPLPSQPSGHCFPVPKKSPSTTSKDTAESSQSSISLFTSMNRETKYLPWVKGIRGITHCTVPLGGRSMRSRENISVEQIK